MGFGNFLKKAVEKVQEVGQAASEASKEAAERRKQQQAEQEEARKNAAEAARREEQEREQDAYEAEQEARRKKLEHYKSLPPTCEKGDCAMCNSHFYYTCPAGCECRRKKLVDNQNQSALTQLEYMPYIKWIENLSQQTEEEGLEILVQSYGKYKTIIIFPSDEVSVTFIENQLPDYIPAMYDLVEILDFDSSLSLYGFREENLFLRFLTRAHACKLDIYYVPSRFLWALKRDRGLFDTLTNRGLDIYIHVNKDFYYNPSLYQRSKDDFEFTLIIFEMLTTREYFESYYPPQSSSIPYDPEKYMAMMLDENGNFKPAGQGGPEKGEWGDTIWNTLNEIEDSADSQTAVEF